MKRILLAIVFSLAVLSIPSFVKRMTGGFRLAKLHVEYPSHPEWNVPFDPELNSLLNQPFHYLDKGSQCYVFESKDRQIVIKLFRFSDARSELKVFTLFNAAHIAFQRMKEETGLLYIHLNISQENLPTIRLKDAIGRTYRLRLDEYRFAIQKKAKSFEIAMQEALKDPILMQSRINQFAALLKTRVEKGIYNSDPTLGRNFGFLENQAIELDFGNFKPILPHSREIEIERYAGKFREWLKQNAPEWVSYLRSSFENSDRLKKME
ncbi:MAG: hypothetical protein K1X28_07380 [Parachlamydiales bacterium]|nr:hypothetical protein [Parachlamydiales bacterium]